MILDTVRFHNVAALPHGLSPDSQLVLEVIRNADKLDAIRNNLTYLEPRRPERQGAQTRRDLGSG